MSSRSSVLIIPEDEESKFSESTYNVMLYHISGDNVTWISLDVLICNRVI